MEIVDVCVCLLRTHTHTYWMCPPTHFWHFFFRSIFKLSCILVKQCQDPFLLFLLILCANRVSSCPHSPLRPFLSPSLLHLCALCSPLPSSQHKKQTSGYSQSPMGAPILHQHIRKGQRGVCLLHVCPVCTCHHPNPLVTHCDSVQSWYLFCDIIKITFECKIAHD